MEVIAARKHFLSNLVEYQDGGVDELVMELDIARGIHAWSMFSDTRIDHTEQIQGSPFHF